jgi:hypothetical protein
MEYTFYDPYTILINERDTFAQYFWCTCYFDLELTIGGLASGLYHAKIERPDDNFVHIFNFTIENGIDEDPYTISSVHSPCGGFTGIKTNTKPTIKVMPNPFTESLTITIDNYRQYELSVYDLSGKQIFRSIMPKDHTINLGHLRPGLYVLMIRSDDHQWYEKIVKQ